MTLGNTIYRRVYRELSRFFLLVDRSEVLSLAFVAMLGIAGIFLFFGGLFNSTNLSFPDLGSFPLHPQESFRLITYDWSIQNLGFQGHQQLYGVIVDGLVVLLGNPGIAEKSWIFSVLFTGTLASYVFARYIVKLRPLLANLFAFTYSFNPITSALVFYGSVNDVLTTYAFFPLIILSLVKSLDESNRYHIRDSIFFALLFSYVFIWNEQVIMWIAPLLVMFFVAKIITARNTRQRLRFFISIVISVGLFVFLTNTWQIIIAFLTFNGGTYFITGPLASSGSASDIFLDFYDNFQGQLTFIYWYAVSIVLGLLLILHRTLTRGSSITPASILHYCLMSESLLVLGIWLIFKIPQHSLGFWIVSYFPLFGAYEPFPGMALLGSLILIDLCMIYPLLAIHVYRKPVLTSSTSHRYGADFRRSILKFCSVILVLLLLFVNLPLWKNPNVPSIASSIQSSQLENKNYAVPSVVKTVANWFHEGSHSYNTPRALVLPQDAYTNLQFDSYLPYISFINISSQLYSQLSPMVSVKPNNHFADILATYSVKYIIVDAGPYTTADSSSVLTGNISFLPSGFSWQRNFLPQGSWTAWSKFLNDSGNFSIVASLRGAFIYENMAFKGMLFSYDIPNVTNSLSSLTFDSYGASISYTKGNNLVSDNWSGFNEYPWKYNWSLKSTSNGVELVGMPLPSNMSYSNIWQEVNMSSSASYSVTYYLNGMHMNHSAIWIRFYTGPNMTGRVISTVGNWFSGSIETSYEVHYIVNTPSTFGSVAIFPTYYRNTSAPNSSFAVFSEIYITELLTIHPRMINQSFINPTRFLFSVNGTNRQQLIIFASSYNSNWVVRNGSKICHSTPLFNGLYLENAFILNTSNSNYTLYFVVQRNYQSSLIESISLWPITIGLLTVLEVLAYVKQKRRS